MNPDRPFNRRTFLRRTGALLLSAPIFPALRAASMTASTPGTGPAFVEKYCLTMGAIASISAYCSDRRHCEEAIAAAFAEMKRIDAMMSSHDPRSGLNGINRAAGRREAAAPPEIITILESARRYHEATRGAFDVTVGPLMELYGFFRGAEPGAYPDDRTIAATLEGVGFANVVTDRGRSAVGLVHPRSRIDLGGIGVGYALDGAARILRSGGIESALLNHSGDILAIGAPPGATGWKIGIQDPEDPRGTVTSFVLKDRSVSTSGNYENFIDTDHGRVGHILDPATGRCPSGFLSVSVMADTSVAADAFSTGFFTGGVRLFSPPPAGDGMISAFTIGLEGGRRSSRYEADVRS